jgi:hypothetical protein
MGEGVEFKDIRGARAGGEEGTGVNPLMTEFILNNIYREVLNLLDRFVATELCGD